MTGTSPSILLHPLDFMGREDCPELAFFPGMDLARERKMAIVAELFDILASRHELVTMAEHARRACRVQRRAAHARAGFHRLARPARPTHARPPGMPFLVFGAALGALFLYLAGRSLDWRAFATAIAGAHPADIALVAGLPRSPTTR